MSRDETPDTTGLVHNHPPYRPVCNERLVDGQLRGACLASPDPAVVTPDAGDVENDVHVLAEEVWNDEPTAAELDLIRLFLASDWLANHVAAAREADRDEAESLRAERDKYIRAFSDQFDQREEYAAECKRLWPIEERAEAAEERLAGLVAKIEAWAVQLDCSAQSGHLRSYCDSCRFATALRALIPADAATDEATS